MTYPAAPVSLANNPGVTTSTAIGLTWSAGATTGGTPVIDYRISWDQGSSNYVPLVIGVTTTSYITSVSLTAGTIYKFKVESRNAFGYSTTYSNEVSIRAASLPDAPISLANNVAITASGVVGLTWSSGAFNGGSSIIDYRISYRASSDAYTVLATAVTTPSFTASSLVANTIYTFKIEARNAVGYSDFSSEVSVRAAARPSTPTAPTTSVILNTSVVLTWLAPFNGGSPLTAYSITLRQSDGSTYSTELANCNGSTLSIITATSCTIPISTLQASPFNLPWGASVYAKISATNIVGTSDLANAGNGGTILTNPDTPQALANIVETTSASVIAFSWTTGLLNGGSAVTEYRVNWD